MRHEKSIPMDYRNEQLMDELNEFMISCKVHLFNLPVDIPKPTIQGMDILTRKLMTELKKDAELLIKY